MDKYNPDQPVDSKNWLALDEAIRIELVHDFHSELDLEMADDALSLHSTIHVLVENQLAMGVELIPETIAKLIRQGLNRHEAIHAIGALISEDIFDVLNGNAEEFSQKNTEENLKKSQRKDGLKGSIKISPYKLLNRANEFRGFHGNQ